MEHEVLVRRYSVTNPGLFAEVYVLVKKYKRKAWAMWKAWDLSGGQYLNGYAVPITLDGGWTGWRTPTGEYLDR